MTIQGIRRLIFSFSALAILFWTGTAAAEEPPERYAGVLKMLDGISLFGDMRVRYEGIFDDTAIGDNRGRMRLRAGFRKAFGDFAALTFRGATGSATDPTSSNQTFTGNFTPKSFFVDEAYGVIRPADGVELFGGKMPMPLLATDLLWDSDLSLEGLAQKFRIAAGGGVFFNFGQWIFNSPTATENSYLLAFQAGLDHKLSDQTRLTVAPAYTHVIRPNATLTVGINGNQTNAAGTALVSEFHVINVPVAIERTLETGKALIFAADIAHNGAAKSLAGKTYDNAYLLELGLASSTKKPKWSAKYRYAKIDPDAILAAFNDSDFSFTDSKGHRLKYEFSPRDFLKFTATGFFLKSVRPGSRPDRTRVQIDTTLSF